MSTPNAPAKFAVATVDTPPSALAEVHTTFRQLAAEAQLDSKAAKAALEDNPWTEKTFLTKTTERYTVLDTTIGTERLAEGMTTAGVIKEANADYQKVAGALTKVMGQLLSLVPNENGIRTHIMGLPEVDIAMGDYHVGALCKIIATQLALRGEDVDVGINWALNMQKLMNMRQEPGQTATAYAKVFKEAVSAVAVMGDVPPEKRLVQVFVAGLDLTLQREMLAGGANPLPESLIKAAERLPRWRAQRSHDE